MNRMTLEEARLIGRQFNECASMPTEKVQEAFRVMDAALPKERKTPGRVCFDAYYERPPSSARAWDKCSDPASWEAGAAAVLKECAVQPEDVTADDAKWLHALFSSGNVPSYLETCRELIRRIQERKGA